MMEMVATTAATRHAKLHSNHHHRQTMQYPAFAGRMPFLTPNHHRQSTRRKSFTFHGLAPSSSYMGSSAIVLTTKNKKVNYRKQIARQQSLSTV